MKLVGVVYHREGNSWWADSEDLPGFSAVGNSFKEVRSLVVEGVDFYLDGEVHSISEMLDNGAFLDPASLRSAISGEWYSMTVTAGIGKGVLPSSPQGLVIRESVPA